MALLQSARRTTERGMMLMEVLVAMAILAMMTTAVWSTFSSTANAMGEMQVIQDRYATVRSAMNRMASELSMAYLSFNRPQAETRHYTLFEGRQDFGNDNVTFSSFAHLRIRKDANESDQSVIQYFVGPDDDDSDRQHLFRRESRRLTGDLPEQMEQFEPAYVLLEDVESIEFMYWDPSQGRYIREWSTIQRDRQSDRVPTVVRFRVGIRPAGEPDADIEYYTSTVALAVREKIDLAKK